MTALSLRYDWIGNAIDLQKFRIGRWVDRVGDQFGVDWAGYDFSYLVADRGDVFAIDVVHFDRVMNVDTDARRADHPIAFALELKRTDEAHRQDWVFEFLSHHEDAVVELADFAVARAGSFGQNHQVDAAIERFLGESKDFAHIGRVLFDGDGDVTVDLHEQAIHRNLEMRFQLHPARKLLRGKIDHERIEDVDVVGDDDVRPLGIVVGHVVHAIARPCAQQKQS